MDGVSFSFFFNKNFLYLLWVPLVGLRGLVWGFGVGCDGLFGGGRGSGLSDASVLGMDRMVCSWGGCVWLVPLSSLVLCLDRVPCLVLGLGSASVVVERDSEQV